MPAALTRMSSEPKALGDGLHAVRAGVEVGRRPAAGNPTSRPSTARWKRATRFVAGEVECDHPAPGAGEGDADRRSEPADAAADAATRVLTRSRSAPPWRRSIATACQPRVLSFSRAVPDGRRAAAGQCLLEILPDLQVALGELVHHRPRRLSEQAAHLLAELLLLLEEHLHRALEVVAHEALQRIAVEADDLAEQLRGEHRLAVLLMLGDDLQQHLPGQVVAALGVAHLEVLALDDQLAHVLDGDVAGDLGVVEPTVGILLDDACGHATAPPVVSRAWRSAAPLATAGVKRHKSPVARAGEQRFSFRNALRSRRRRKVAPARQARYQPMYCPPFADRFAPVIQAASSGMKKATA